MIHPVFNNNPGYNIRYGGWEASNRGFLAITLVWVTQPYKTLDVANMHEDLAWLFFAEILVVGSLCANLT